jgi:hypothetical protein
MDCGTGMPIEGLRLTFQGDELRTLLEERQREHERWAAHWRHELTRTHEDATEDAPLLPDHICENKIEREEWRADVMAFIRDHRPYRAGRNVPARTG